MKAYKPAIQSIEESAFIKGYEARKVSSTLTTELYLTMGKLLNEKNALHLCKWFKAGYEERMVHEEIDLELAAR